MAAASERYTRVEVRAIDNAVGSSVSLAATPSSESNPDATMLHDRSAPTRDDFVEHFTITSAALHGPDARTSFVNPNRADVRDLDRPIEAIRRPAQGTGDMGPGRMEVRAIDNAVGSSVGLAATPSLEPIGPRRGPPGLERRTVEARPTHDAEQGMRDAGRAVDPSDRLAISPGSSRSVPQSCDLAHDSNGYLSRYCEQGFSAAGQPPPLRGVELPAPMPHHSGMPGGMPSVR
jgi:hypothetical protein